MADEAQYSSGTDTGSNKRKYDEQMTPPPRRATGFSAPIASTSPDSAPPAYNSVPPPVDEIQLAKQRAQEIAARLYNNASGAAGAGGALDAKRPRVENGGGFDASDRGFSSLPSGSPSLLSVYVSFTFVFFSIFICMYIYVCIFWVLWICY